MDKDKIRKVAAKILDMMTDEEVDPLEGMAVLSAVLGSMSYALSDLIEKFRDSVRTAGQS